MERRAQSKVHPFFAKHQQKSTNTREKNVHWDLPNTEGHSRYELNETTDQRRGGQGRDWQSRRDGCFKGKSGNTLKTQSAPRLMHTEFVPFRETQLETDTIAILLNQIHKPSCFDQLKRKEMIFYYDRTPPINQSNK
jgi:hypothetical protein